MRRICASTFRQTAAARTFNFQLPAMGRDTNDHLAETQSSIYGIDAEKT
jgi:hypothetical protein